MYFSFLIFSGIKLSGYLIEYLLQSIDIHFFIMKDCSSKENFQIIL